MTATQPNDLRANPSAAAETSSSGGPSYDQPTEPAARPCLPYPDEEIQYVDIGGTGGGSTPMLRGWSQG